MWRMLEMKGKWNAVSDEMNVHEVALIVVVFWMELQNHLKIFSSWNHALKL